MSLSVLPLFSSESFIVSGPTFRSLIHYLSVWCQEVFEFYSYTCSCPVFPAPFMEDTFFAHSIFLPPLSKIRYPQVQGFISGLSTLFHWSIFQFLCQYHTVLMTVSLQYNLKSDYIDFYLVYIHWQSMWSGHCT